MTDMTDTTDTADSPATVATVATPDSLREQAELLVALAREKNLKLTFAESCTGGLLAASLTAVAGASLVFEYGFITYANRAKTQLLGVAPEVLREHGAVSEETARAMAIGAQSRADADIAIAITGIAGPTGDTPAGAVPTGAVLTGAVPTKGDKPVGLVCFAFARRGRPILSHTKNFANLATTDTKTQRIQRTEIQKKAAAFALTTTLNLISTTTPPSPVLK